MIIVRYRGGLGNQIFQHAFQISLMKKYPNTEILADISHYEINNEHNGFELEKVFGIRMDLCDRGTLRAYSPHYVSLGEFDKYPSVYKQYVRTKGQFKYARRRVSKDNVYLQKSHCSYEPKVYDFIESKLTSKEPVYLDGLWQDIRYFEDAKDEVLKAYSLSLTNPADIALLKEIEGNSKHTIGIHVRRGDFANSKFDICSLDYYKKALQMVETDDANFYFFTDDPQYVEEAFSFLSSKKVISHETSQSYVDMILMGACDTLILSNSTFAFWSAYLSHDAKRVFSPKYSVIKGEEKYTLKCPEFWQVIDNDVT